MPCTTILVGKLASYDGSTLVARNEDSGAGAYNPKNFRVVQPEDQPRHYKAVLSKLELDLPDDPQRYTVMPNATPEEGIWGACGFNDSNVFMTATETLTSNERVQGADPLVMYKKAQGQEGDPDYQPEQVGGIGEEDMVTLVLPYIKSAREGVLRLGSLVEEYGTCEMNGIAFSDVEEIWWLETVGGHNWIARRVPDECYVIMPNQLGLDYFDLDDAYGEQVDYLCSEGLQDLIDDYNLDLSMDGTLNPRDAFGSHSDADHVYNTPRAWVLQRYLSPSAALWDGPDADYRPESDDLPWCLEPDRLITVEDVKYTMSHHFQGTPYDPYGKHGGEETKGKYRPIGINRNNFLGLGQIRPNQPEAIQCLEWLALGSNIFNAMLPFYANVDTTPDYLAQTDHLVTTESFYWVNRLIAALADAHYSECSNLIERYQIKLQSKGWEIIHRYDQGYDPTWDPETTRAYLAKANEEIAAEAKKASYELLDKVLVAASDNMKCAYKRSDA